MLLSPRAEIEVVLAPPRMAGCAHPGAPAWGPALAALERALDGGVRRGTRLNVVLSNRFVRYAVVPWHDGLHGAAEDDAYVRHVFVDTYGSAADSWDLCVSAAAAGQPRLASAIDADLLAALRSLCTGRGFVLRAVWPRLGYIFNRHRKSVGAGSGWLVLAEPECLCIALFDAGRWLSVSLARLPARWQHALPQLLERAACLADPAGTADRVYWWTAQEEGEPPAPDARFTFHRLGAEAP